MASGVFNRGSYTVSGIAPAQTGISENFQAGLQANLNRQDARSAMDARAEQARLARSADRRAQTELEMRQEAARRQQAAAAASAARAAQQRAAVQARIQAGLQTPASTETGVMAARDRNVQLPLINPPRGSSMVPGLPDPFAALMPGGAAAPAQPGPRAGIQLPGPAGGPAGGPAVAPAAPRVGVAAPQRSFMTPESMDIRAGIGQYSPGVVTSGVPANVPPGADVTVGSTPYRMFRDGTAMNLSTGFLLDDESDPDGRLRIDLRQAARTSGPTGGLSIMQPYNYSQAQRTMEDVDRELADATARANANPNAETLGAVRRLAQERDSFYATPQTEGVYRGERGIMS